MRKCGETPGAGAERRRRVGRALFAIFLLGLLAPRSGLEVHRHAGDVAGHVHLETASSRAAHRDHHHDEAAPREPFSHRHDAHGHAHEIAAGDGHGHAHEIAARDGHGHAHEIAGGDGHGHAHEIAGGDGRGHTHHDARLHDGRDGHARHEDDARHAHARHASEAAPGERGRATGLELAAPSLAPHLHAYDPYQRSLPSEVALPPVVLAAAPLRWAAVPATPVERREAARARGPPSFLVRI